MSDEVKTDASRVEREPKFWTCDDAVEELSCDTIGEAVEEWAWHIRPARLPEAIEVYGFAPKAPPTLEDVRGDSLDRLLEWLDDEHGDPDDGTTPTPAMRAAEEAFHAAVLAEYTVWRCERVTTRTVKVADYYTAAARGMSTRELYRRAAASAEIVNNVPLAGAPEHRDQGRGQDEGYCDRCGVTVAPKGCALAECGWCKGARPPEYAQPVVHPARPRDEEVERLAEVVAFLLGEGELDGCWYGEAPSTARGAFWWRNHLRGAFNAAALRSPVREAQEPEKLVEKVRAALYALYISGRRQEARDNWTPESFREDAILLLTDCGLLPRRES